MLIVVSHWMLSDNIEYSSCKLLQVWYAYMMHEEELIDIIKKKSRSKRGLQTNTDT